MTIHLPADLETAIAGEAQRLGTTPDVVIERVLRQQFATRPSAPISGKAAEKLNRLLAIARPCGVAIPNEALSREELYD